MIKMLLKSYEKGGVEVNKDFKDFNGMIYFLNDIASKVSRHTRYGNSNETGLVIDGERYTISKCDFKNESQVDFAHRWFTPNGDKTIDDVFSGTTVTFVSCGVMNFDGFKLGRISKCIDSKIDGGSLTIHNLKGLSILERSEFNCEGIFTNIGRGTNTAKIGKWKDCKFTLDLANSTSSMVLRGYPKNLSFFGKGGGRIYVDNGNEYDKDGFDGLHIENFDMVTLSEPHTNNIKQSKNVSIIKCRVLALVHADLDQSKIDVEQLDIRSIKFLQGGIRNTEITFKKKIATLVCNETHWSQRDEYPPHFEGTTIEFGEDTELDTQFRIHDDDAINKLTPLIGDEERATQFYVHNAVNGNYKLIEILGASKKAGIFTNYVDYLKSITTIKNLFNFLGVDIKEFDTEAIND